MPQNSQKTSSLIADKNIEPRFYDVVMHNDDITTMDFVVTILRQVFFHSPELATTLMLNIHNTGKAIVGRYAYDIAKSKADKAMRMARDNGFPLVVTIELNDKPF